MFIMKVRHCHKDSYETCIEMHLYAIMLNSHLVVKSVYQLNFTWHVLIEALK